MKVTSRVVLALSVLGAALVEAFVPSSVIGSLQQQQFSPVKPSAALDRTWRQVSQLDAPSTENKKKENGDEPTVWECDEEANCVEVAACDEEQCRTSLDVRIHGTWYDLSGWRKAHPAGTHWIDWYDGRDATEVMDAFHSEKGRSMVQRLPKSVEPTATMLDSLAPPDTKLQIAFRKFRTELEAEGWWERDTSMDVKLIGIWGSLVLVAAATAHTVAPFSIMALSLSFTAAGWLGHDYCHGVDDWSVRLRNFAAVAAGLLPTWWVDKHNKHHAMTNEKGVDEDIATDPFLYQWAPDPADDSPLRKIQHYSFLVAFSFMFALWRYDSINSAIANLKKNRMHAEEEMKGLLIHYAVLLTVFPVGVWVPAVFISGLMSALIVTPTHQSEELFDEFQPDWVAAQFLSTRNAVTTNPFSEWLWGGMQYQLEHHLFPSMPRAKYPALRNRLKKFAEDNEIPGGYRESGEFEILKMNRDLYKKIAKSPAVDGAISTLGREGQVGSIQSTRK
ncbi:Acyl-lipid (9-3)-desaturase [Seminavis robusta]|uniref:Acyl-lipid (9-3)-desaturase n=1 Tax=Seminavis robusta TaxID=568900 RepID=A0A9N8DSC6_9STRA|nr:Acyl-lipid (9-3)-desaturase [Seminavis robusta]|eukprot:Sro335_g120190.1 Acyl-lipid (9-3)-desaturase (504) ;mRNA; f:61212-62845